MSNLIFPDLPGRINQTRTLFYSTSVQTADSGAEYRFSRYGRPRYRYTINHNFTRADSSRLEAQAIASHLVRHGAQRESFLLRDHLDHTVTAHGFGVGNGSSTKFPLQRTEGGRWTDILGTWDTYTTPRTNLSKQSETLGTTWIPSRASVSSDLAISPLGTLTADKIIEDGTASNTHLLVGPELTLLDSTVYTASVYLRASTRTRARVALRTKTGSEPGCNVDLATGATTAAGTPDVGAVAVGGGWYRVFVTASSGSGATIPRITIHLADGTGSITYNGDGTSALFAWGAQVEEASAATRYIPTTSASVRADPSYWTANQSTGALVAPGTSEGFDPITEPLWSGVTIYKDGVAQVPVTDFTYAAGLVTFAVAPASGAALSWSGSFLRRVRFDDDELSFERIVSDVLEGPGVELVSVIA